jgi:two-component system, sensor histidine kinase
LRHHRGPKRGQISLGIYSVFGPHHQPGTYRQHAGNTRPRMNSTGAFDLRAKPQRVWLAAVAGVLAFVLLAIGYVQWRQYKLLDSASQYQNDTLSWSFSQLETEQLRLRNQLQLYLTDSQHLDLDKVQVRYEIFVSRVNLVDNERAAHIMQDNVNYIPTLVQVRNFVQTADRSLNTTTGEQLNLNSVRELITQLDGLNVPLHDMSLSASHLFYQRATERNHAVRQQAALSIALTAFQCLLLLTLAFIVLRQVRALTERRRALETLADNLSAARLGAEAASRAKSVFLANMSHEIRTPFHGLLGMLSLLQDGGLTPQQASHLDTARESANHLLTVLNGILDISQLESGKLQVVPQTVDLLQLITQVDALMRVQAQGKGLALQVDVAPDVPRWVRADPTRVKQILFNLLSNALKFTSAGQISLQVSTRLQPTGSNVNNGANSGVSTNFLDFVVTDSGIGMDTATCNRLFQRFMQGDESPSRQAGGTGLGLEISRDLARLMGGDITARSEVGVGSTFTAYLPLSAVSPPTFTLDTNLTKESNNFKQLRVLVAEDHPVNRAYMEAVLEKLGHLAVFKTDGDSAVRAVQEQPADEPFDIVLMDLHMPGMDGFTAARNIRAMVGPRGRVPIVALTADAFQESRDLARSAGMDGFLTKPAHLPQLRDALERYGSSAPTQIKHQPTNSGDDKVLDTTTVADLRQTLSASQYAQLLNTYFEAQTQMLTELHAAADAGKLARLDDRAHALKGASLSLGLHQMGAAADKLQNAAASNVLIEVKQCIHDLQIAFNESFEECLRQGLLQGNSQGNSQGDTAHAAEHAPGNEEKTDLIKPPPAQSPT